MKTDDILSIASKTLDQGLYFGKGKITRATDSEIVCFADAIARPLAARISALEERLLLIYKTTSDSTTKSIVRIDDIIKDGSAGGGE